MIECDICSKVFSRRSNMLRHRRRLHDLDSEEEIAESQAGTDLSDYEDYSDDGEEDAASESDSQETSDEDPWDDIVNDAFVECQSQYEDEVKDLLVSEDIDQTKARSEAFEKLRPVYRKAIIRKFMSKMIWYNSIKKDRIFKAIKRTVMRLENEEGYGKEEAWKYSTSKRKYLFDNILKRYLPPTMSEPEDMDTDDNEEQDDVTAPE